MAIKTTAADKFIAEIVAGNRSLDYYQAVVQGGLYAADRESLRSACTKSEEDYATAKREVIEFARFQVWRLRPDHGLGVAESDQPDLRDADGYLDFGKLAPDWVDSTNPDNFSAEEIARIKNAPDRAAEIEAALAEKAKDLPSDVRALGW